MRSGDELRAPFGYVARRYIRPVEINTIFHVMPGTKSLTFGNFGCDLACPYCQNAYISQAIRDGRDDQTPIDVTAEELADEAVRERCSTVCAAYNEPMISVEWVRAVFEASKQRGLKTAVITDGHTTPEALGYLRPVLDVFRVDLKAHDEASYRTLGGELGAVWASVEHARELGLWVELVTLLVPGLNDSADAIRSIARRIAALDPDIPWHINGFLPRYRMKDRPATPPSLLVDAAGIGYGAGLSYVYASNVATLVELGHTRCPRCASNVLERADYRLARSTLRDGACGACGARIAGVFD